MGETVACERCGDSCDAEMRRLRWETNYRVEMHRQAMLRVQRLKSAFRTHVARVRQEVDDARARVKVLEKELAETKALLQLRQKQAFGKKTERRGRLEVRDRDKQVRPRGQQQGSVGHGRRRYDNLPAVIEPIELPPDQCFCSKCHLPRVQRSDEESTVLEVEVKAHRRVIRRARWERTCTCAGAPQIVVAPRPGQLIPRGLLGVSVWVFLLLEKFLLQQPMERTLRLLRLQGLHVSPGTVTDGLARLAPLFKPVVDGILEKLRAGPLWQADETRWFVFAQHEGKTGYRWYLWAFMSSYAVYYELDPSRSARVPERVLRAPTDEPRQLLTDRYSSYKCYAKGHPHVLLCFCWAHVRRDFVVVVVMNPTLCEWARTWVERIGRLYALNDERLAVLNAGGTAIKENQALVTWVSEMETIRDAELCTAVADGVEQKQKLLRSLQKHWTGLTYFVEYPEIPMDNNAIERQQRDPVLGRKSYYGSRAEWAGYFAASMFSVLQTLERNGLNAQLWLTAYLQACADNGGRPPADAMAYLPWNLSDERRAQWALVEKKATAPAPVAPAVVVPPASSLHNAVQAADGAPKENADALLRQGVRRTRSREGPADRLGRSAAFTS